MNPVSGRSFLAGAAVTGLAGSTVFGGTAFGSTVFADPAGTIAPRRPSASPRTGS